LVLVKLVEVGGIEAMNDGQKWRDESPAII